jgi:hypothetical protein
MLAAATAPPYALPSAASAVRRTSPGLSTPGTLSFPMVMPYLPAGVQYAHDVCQIVKQAGNITVQTGSIAISPPLTGTSGTKKQFQQRQPIAQHNSFAALTMDDHDSDTAIVTMMTEPVRKSSASSRGRNGSRASSGSATPVRSSASVPSGLNHALLSTKLKPLSESQSMELGDTKRGRSGSAHSTAASSTVNTPMMVSTSASSTPLNNATTRWASHVTPLALASQFDAAATTAATSASTTSASVNARPLTARQITKTVSDIYDSFAELPIRIESGTTTDAGVSLACNSVILGVSGSGKSSLLQGLVALRSRWPELLTVMVQTPTSIQLPPMLVFEAARLQFDAQAAREQFEAKFDLSSALTLLLLSDSPIPTSNQPSMRSGHGHGHMSGTGTGQWNPFAHANWCHRVQWIEDQLIRYSRKSYLAKVVVALNLIEQ